MGQQNSCKTLIGMQSTMQGHTVVYTQLSRVMGGSSQVIVSNIITLGFQIPN